MRYSIKQASQMLGMTEHTIRYYTDMELFPCKRDSGNRRILDDEAINWLTGIRHLRACQMPLEAIKEYCDLCLQGDTTIHERYRIILEQKELAKARLAEAQQVFEYMETKAAHYKEIVDQQIPDDTNPNTWGGSHSDSKSCAV